MAIVRSLELLALEHSNAHTETNCTYSIILDSHGRKCLQIDTYGSNSRKIRGKKSQSIRFAPEALEQLKELLTKEF
jgi:hypothetical protein